jgi:homogentisate 1,2-dioxygenase
MEVLLRTTLEPEGFHGNSALLYHVHHTREKKIKSYSAKIAIKNIKPVVKRIDLKAEDDFLDSRKALLVNKDLYRLVSNLAIS